MQATMYKWERKATIDQLQSLSVIPSQRGEAVKGEAEKFQMCRSTRLTIPTELNQPAKLAEEVTREMRPPTTRLYTQHRRFRYPPAREGSTIPQQSTTSSAESTIKGSPMMMICLSYLISFPLVSSAITPMHHKMPFSRQRTTTIAWEKFGDRPSTVRSTPVCSASCFPHCAVLPGEDLLIFLAPRTNARDDNSSPLHKGQERRRGDSDRRPSVRGKKNPKMQTSQDHGYLWRRPRRGKRRRNQRGSNSSLRSFTHQCRLLVY